MFQGNLVTWWAKEAKTNYLKKAQCIIGRSKCLGYTFFKVYGIM